MDCKLIWLQLRKLGWRVASYFVCLHRACQEILHTADHDSRLDALKTNKIHIYQYDIYFILKLVRAVLYNVHWVDFRLRTLGSETEITQMRRY